MSLPSPVHLETERLVMTMPGSTDAPRMVEYFERNREHFLPWDPAYPDGFFTTAYWEARLAENRKEHIEDRSLRLVLFARGDDSRYVVGCTNYTSFVRASFQACYLGYNVDHRHEGRGLMREALEASTRYVFEELGMHRIQANYQPNNERSARLLRRLGFVIEGYAKSYLLIGGTWRDHVLTSLTKV
jgi:ribosomal-protein-alanine N-acetyltransferase